MPLEWQAEEACNASVIWTCDFFGCKRKLPPSVFKISKVPDPENVADTNTKPAGRSSLEFCRLSMAVTQIPLQRRMGKQHYFLLFTLFTFPIFTVNPLHFLFFTFCTFVFFLFVLFILFFTFYPLYFLFFDFRLFVLSVFHVFLKKKLFFFTFDTFLTFYFFCVFFNFLYFYSHFFFFLFSFLFYFLCF